MSGSSKVGMGAHAQDSMIARNAVGFVDDLFDGPDGISFLNIKGIRIVRANGDVEEVSFEIPDKNLVVNEGRNHVRDVIWAAGTQVTTWSIGLLSATPTIAAGDTAAQIGGTNGWSEVTDYTEGVREAFVEAATGTGQVDNSASVASFAINATVTVGGVFMISIATKGALTGTLLAAVAFSGGNRALQSGDTLEITYTMTTADDGV